MLFKDYLHVNQIKHSMFLNAALRILSSPIDYFSKNDEARKCISYFIENMKLLYGEEHLIYNIHNLSHLCDEVLKFGPLYNFSAYTYENELQLLKHMVRKGDLPLSQIVKRISENVFINSKEFIIENQVPYRLINKCNYNDDLPEGFNNQFEKIQFEHFLISNQIPNNCCYLKNNTVIRVDAICHNSSNKLVVLGKRFVNATSIDNYPFDLRIINVFKVKEYFTQQEVWPVDEISKKGFIIPYEDYFYILPLLHTCLE